ncbi:uncharacterized protein LOC106878214 isoform X3 [Octopus bimaculoides]|uniref:uncharacterized protein LOC106878214 isoform X3 n=1 Tax=Octopus bimaculoides TaxID=37653 RepID=UPI00071DC290|nr:uncharacterized protein LOC106878214 isoform X3 [Octopus bimaculoides]|eukprot:XP_014782848.1 PREDICTED: uncharacterized protein LOC106878214 isoform X3 [Octopus bimaculoides]
MFRIAVFLACLLVTQAAFNTFQNGMYFDVVPDKDGEEVDAMSDVYDTTNDKSLAERVAEAISVFSDESLAPARVKRAAREPMELKIMPLDN